GETLGGTGALNVGAGGVVRVNNPTHTGYDITIGNEDPLLGGSISGTATGAASGQAIVSGPGAVLDANGTGIAVGFLTTGALTISQGGSVVSGTTDESVSNALSIGRRGTGSVTITDPGSTFTANGVVYVGRSGTGSLTIENHGSLIGGLDAKGGGGINIGGVGLSVTGGVTYLVPGGSGTALVTGGGFMTTPQKLNIGTNGTNGSLTVNQGGTAVAGGQITIGDSVDLPAGDSIITPSGSFVASFGTLITSDGVLNVGPGGSVIRSGGTHAAGIAGVVVGNGSGSSGTVNVTGGGLPPVGTTVINPALLSTGGDSLVVGESGQGQMVVSSGGTVLAGTQFASDSAVLIGAMPGTSGFLEIADLGPTQGVVIGQFSGGAGNLSVMGLGSQLSNTGRFVVGDQGLGSLTIANAAT